MSILQSYPKGTPKKGDYIIGTSIPPANSDEMPTTRNFTVDSIASLGSAPDIATKTILITTEQLEALGTTYVTLLTLSGGSVDGEYLQLISASILAGGGALGSGYTWDAAGAYISWNAVGLADNNRIIIPQSQLPSGGGLIGPPYNIAAEDGIYRRGGSLRLGTAADPVITGTPNGTLTINLTYRLFP